MFFSSKEAILTFAEIKQVITAIYKRKYGFIVIFDDQDCYIQFEYLKQPHLNVDCFVNNSDYLKVKTDKSLRSHAIIALFDYFINNENKLSPQYKWVANPKICISAEDD